ncbi:hypothetical protein [Runella slithyformis]|uniref:hypothetical protein n=1 Tax=Runella slithyformis TaxID=106 RepID=UPI00031078AE|nr:hypothetical protein [Runella slithyformis]
MMKSIPPLNDLFNMAGLNLPEYLNGKEDIQKLPENLPQEQKIHKRYLSGHFKLIFLFKSLKTF